MPGIIPRARKLFASGFGMIAYLMAEIYAMVRLLPRNHPYLQPRNIGNYGLRHVIAAAANHLVIKKENIDQIIVFFALLCGSVLLLMQFVLLIAGFILTPANAQSAAGSESGSIFVTAKPTNDIAFVMLDKVFGVPDFFCTGKLCSKAQADIPYPMHTALHSLFEFYTMGLLIVGVLIFLYFVVVVTAETATTGSPFGQRFQNIWVPIRLITAIGLLLPLNYGFNTAQYITFYAAKMGSGFATNTWLAYNNAIKQHPLFNGSRNNPLGEYDSLIGMPKPADASILTEMMSLIHSCAYATDKKYASSLTGGGLESSYSAGPYELVEAFLVKTPVPGQKNQDEFLKLSPSTTHVQAVDFFNNGDITIRFGRQSTFAFDDEPGDVENTCGEIRIPVVDIANKGKGDEVGGADYILNKYFEYIKEMWFTNPEFQDFAARFMEIVLAPEPSVSAGHRDVNGDLACRKACNNPHIVDCKIPSIHEKAPCETKEGLPKEDWKQNVIDQYTANFKKDLTTAWAKYTENADIEISQDVLDLGWGGAGVWYNKIAQLNGAFVSAVMATPRLISYPKVMREVAAFSRRTNQDAGGLSQFAPITSGPKPTSIPSREDGLEIATALNDVYEFWNKGIRNSGDKKQENSANILMRGINLLLGTAGIFSIREENAFIHPLAQLTVIGKGLVESSIMNIMGASVSAFAGGAISVFKGTGGIGQLANGMSSLLQQVAFIGLTAGVILFYILPFLPFLYFFFAVGEWIKAIFEAMVGVPLWALAHLRLDGEGLPGEAAKDGYFLILEIFLRPILTVIALIAATVIFSAQVRVLNAIWDLAVSASPGYQANATVQLGDIIKFDRNKIDKFFYTLVYTLVVYLMATSSFKLINQIPDNLLRWAGAGVSAFGDINKEDPLQGLQRYAAIGGITIGRQAVQATTDAFRGMGQVAGEAVKADGVTPSMLGKRILGERGPRG